MKRRSVAVIGEGLGGMTAAGELAHAGHRVVLFEQSPTLGGKAQVVSKSGVSLDNGPTLLTLPHVLRTAFSRMGADDLLPRFIRLPYRRLGPFRRPRIPSGTRDVFYAGGGTHPGGRVPLVMLSGRFAGEIALQHLGECR